MMSAGFAFSLFLGFAFPWDSFIVGLLLPYSDIFNSAAKEFLFLAVVAKIPLLSIVDSD